MKLLCQIWFWFDVATAAVYLFVAGFSDGYPRMRKPVTRGEDMLRVFGASGFAAYLYYAIWVRGTP